MVKSGWIDELLFKSCYIDILLLITAKLLPTTAKDPTSKSDVSIKKEVGVYLNDPDLAYCHSGQSINSSFN